MLGIGILTKNRSEAFNKCLAHHLMYQSKGSQLVVVDNGSDNIYVNADYRFEIGMSISHGKNKIIELLYDKGVTDFFIFEDDVFPICDDWHLPYVNSGIHHLCRTFYKPFKTVGNINHYRLGNGMACYYTKHCIDTVGGFDQRFRNKFEHTEHSRRIFNAGLIESAYMDVINSNKLIYSMDENNAIERSFTPKEMQKNLDDGRALFNSLRNSKEFVPFNT